MTHMTHKNMRKTRKFVHQQLVTISANYGGITAAMKSVPGVLSAACMHARYTEVHSALQPTGEAAQL